MKKAFFTILAITVSILMSTAAFAFVDDYPGSIDFWGLDKPAGSELIVGEPSYIGTNFSETPDNYNYVCVFDGNITTYYAPLNDDFGPGNIVYIKTDGTAYSVTEIRYVCREDKPERTVGLHFVGSNDGENWTDLYVEDTQQEYDYICITKDKILTNEAFTYFGVYQGQEDVLLNIAEMEFWGVKGTAGAAAPAAAEAPAETEAPAAETEAPAAVETTAAVTTTAPQTSDTLIALITAVSVAGVFTLASKKKH